MASDQFRDITEGIENLERTVETTNVRGQDAAALLPLANNLVTGIVEAYRLTDDLDDHLKLGTLEFRILRCRSEIIRRKSLAN